MLKFLLNNNNMHKGLYAAGPEIEIVVEDEVYTFDRDGRPWIEPGPSLADVEAMMRYIQGQFPDGWRIVDGVVCGWIPNKENHDA